MAQITYLWPNTNGTSTQILKTANASADGTIQTVWADNTEGSVVSVTGGDHITMTGTATAPVVNYSGILETTLGGTGVGTLTNHGVLLGAGTSAIAATTAGTAGQFLQSNGASADPSFATVNINNAYIATSAAHTVPTSGVEKILWTPTAALLSFLTTSSSGVVSCFIPAGVYISSPDSLSLKFGIGTDQVEQNFTTGTEGVDFTTVTTISPYPTLSISGLLLTAPLSTLFHVSTTKLGIFVSNTTGTNYFSSFSSSAVFYRQTSVVINT